jgi:hypothetical protein
MYFAADEIDKIGGRTVRRTLSATGEERAGPVRNTFLAELASAFIDAGLGTEEEAYCCIIPPLSEAKKLPTMEPEGQT